MHARPLAYRSSGPHHRPINRHRLRWGAGLPKTDQTSYEHIVRALPFIAAACMVVCAAVCSQTVAKWLDAQPPLAPPLAEAIHKSQTAFFIAAFVLLVFGLILRGEPTFDRILRHRSAQRSIVSIFVSLTPLFVLEVGFRPIAASRRWDIYTIDVQRGWKHRPNAMDYVVQLPVRINSLGHRGPEIRRIKPPGTHRLLFLGDSVVFGQGIASDDETIPQQVAVCLEKKSSRPIQAINAGVCGYSPWQHHIYLQEEGLSLSPDVVLTNFVLNDVTEKFNLPRFGGTQPSDQLLAAATSVVPHWLADSGLYFIAKAIAGRCRFGHAPRRSATRFEMLGVKSLCERPDDPAVRYAWRVTLANLHKIIRTAEFAGASNVLVVYPFSFQLESGQPAVPQQVLAAFARELGVPLLDLLPVYRRAMARDGLTQEDIFLDFCHPTSLGARIAAEAIAEFLAERGLDADDRTMAGDLVWTRR